LRSLIRVREVEVGLEREALRERIEEAVSTFAEYLEKDFIPEARGAWTMHSMLGPVGKLLALLETGRAYTEDEVVGYAMRVHEQTAIETQRLTPEAVERLRKGVRILLDVRSKVSKREWPKVISSVRYGVYQRAMEAALKRAEAKRAKKEGGGEE